jgi:hypothetical protein
MVFRGERQRIRSARGVRREAEDWGRRFSVAAIVSRATAHARGRRLVRMVRLNRHTRRRASKNFENSAAAEARRAQLQATFDRHSRVRDDACHTSKDTPAKLAAPHALLARVAVARACAIPRGG